MADSILNNSDNLRNGTVIHAVAGTGDKYDALLQMENATKGKRVSVKAYKYSPLINMMAEADLNIMRPHGTSIVEAKAVGKPYVLFLPSNITSGVAFTNAKVTSSESGIPFVNEPNLGQNIEGLQNNWDPEVKKYLAMQDSSGAKAGVDLIETIKKITPSISNRMRLLRIGLGIMAAPLGAGMLFSKSTTSPQNKSKKSH